MACDRLLALIAKGVTVEQVAQVTRNFNQAGIVVHAYLMYGFPTQTAQETVDSLEVVRQLFEQSVLQSAFWHRFAMTAHSPLGLAPADFAVHNHTGVGAFANNDLVHTDPTGADHDLYGDGLKKSFYNYMHGVGLDHDLQEWFEHQIPETSLPPDLIYEHLVRPDTSQPKVNQKVVWLGGPATYDIASKRLLITTKQSEHRVKCKAEVGVWLEKVLQDIRVSVGGEALSFGAFRQNFETAELTDFELFWPGRAAEELREVGLW